MEEPLGDFEFVPMISIGTDKKGGSLTLHMHGRKFVYGQLMMRVAASLGLLYQEAMNQPPMNTDDMLTFTEYWDAMGNYARRAADISLAGGVDRVTRAEVEST